MLKICIYIIMVLLMVLFFVVCSSNNGESIEDTSPELTPTINPSPLPTPTQALLYPPNLGITIDDTLSVIDGVPGLSGSIRPFALYNDIYVTTKGRNVFIYHNDEFVTTIVIRVSSTASNLTISNINNVLETLKEMLSLDVQRKVVHGSDIFGNDRLFILTVEHDIGFNFESLLFHVSEKATTDFFTIQSNIERFRLLINRGAFAELHELVSTHIERYGAQIYDSAWILLNYLEPMMAQLDQIEIIYDDFDDVATIFYIGLTNISSTHNFIPYTTTRNNGFNIKVGFYNDEWIFADRARVRLENGETVQISMSRPIRDVVRGGIRETFSTSIINDSLLESRPIAIRFEGRDRQLDIDLTPAEQNALEVVYVFRYTNIFSDLLSHFQHP